MINVVDHDVVEKTIYDELVKKYNAIRAINASKLFKKTDYNAKTKNIEKNLQIILYKLLLRKLMDFQANEFNKFNISLLGNQKEYLNPTLSPHFIFSHPG